MSDKVFSIEVDSKFIDELFGLANLPAPNEIELSALYGVIDTVKQKLDNAVLSQASQAIPTKEGNPGLSPTSAVSGNRPNSILIVDDLGIITYQLEVLFKKLGFDVTISKEMYDAIEKYKTQDFGYTILDLYIPTEREGFLLLDEIKKLSLLCQLNTKIIVMSASAKEEYKEKCLNRGADNFIEKTMGWQKELIEICKE